MKIEIILVSKDKTSWVKEGCAQYFKRLTSISDVSFIFIKESYVMEDEEKTKKIEGERIIEKLKSGYIKIALDVKGVQYSSEDFAKRIEKLKDFEGGKVQFIIGGPLGLSGEVLAQVDESISFSSMTFTHQLIRVMLLEQIYRAFEILKGSGYHKD